METGLSAAELNVLLATICITFLGALGCLGLAMAPQNAPTGWREKMRNLLWPYFIVAIMVFPPVLFLPSLVKVKNK